MPREIHVISAFQCAAAAGQPFLHELDEPDRTTHTIQVRYKHVVTGQCWPSDGLPAIITIVECWLGKIYDGLPMTCPEFHCHLLILSTLHVFFFLVLL